MADAVRVHPLLSNMETREHQYKPGELEDARQMWGEFNEHTEPRADLMAESGDEAALKAEMEKTLLSIEIERNQLTRQMVFHDAARRHITDLLENGTIPPDTPAENLPAFLAQRVEEIRDRLNEFPPQPGERVRSHASARQETQKPGSAVKEPGEMTPEELVQELKRLAYLCRTVDSSRIETGYGMTPEEFIAFADDRIKKIQEEFTRRLG